MNSIDFLPAVPIDCRDAVESLFFFNPGQGRLREGIRASVERHGLPEIVEQDGRLWIGLPSGATQCLFAWDRSEEPGWPVGVILYARTEPEVIAVTHLAVDPDYSSGGRQFSDGVGVLLIDKVRQIGLRINGVRRIELPYRPGCYLPVTGMKSEIRASKSG